MSADAPPWRFALGGPNAVNLPAWVLTLVGGTAAAFAWVPRGEPVNLLHWVALSVAAQCLLGAILFVAWLTYLAPGSRPSRPWALIVTLLVAGAVRGAFLSWAGEALDLVGDGQIIGRALGTALSFTVWFIVFTLIVDEWRSHRAAMARLRREIEREREIAERTVAIVTRLRADLVSRTENVVSARLDAALAVADQPRLASAALRDAIDDAIRPLSHELELRSLEDSEVLKDAESLGTQPRPSVRVYFMSIFTARPFAPLVTAVIVVSTPLFATLRVLGLGAGALAIVVAGVGVGGGLAAVRRPVMAAIPTWRSWTPIVVVPLLWTLITLVVGAALALVVMLSNVTPDSWLLNVGFSSTGATVVVIALLAITTMVAAAVEGSVRHQHAIVESELRDAIASVEWASARLRQEAWNEQRRFSRALHGSIQARVAAAAIQVDDQAPDEAAETIARLSESIRDSLLETASRPWREERASLADVWCGAIDLVISQDPEVDRAQDLDPIAAQALTSVLTEAVTNAVRHGNADSVRVTISAEPGFLAITVKDDGRPCILPERRGLGTRIFDANCLSWSLTFDSSTTFCARIACASTVGKVVA